MISRFGRLAAAASLAAVWLLPAGGPSRAAAMAGASAPGQRALSALPAQAAAPGPNIEANITQLHQRLQITPAQEPRFNAFANVMRANARMTPSAPPANPSAVDDLRVAIQVSAQELDALKRLLPPLEALYASLSPAQQRTADQVFRQGPGE
jgi:periplasmic protein CpxP/Spy